MNDDATLLRRYATENSSEAFAELVRRHLPLVYSAALRRLNGDAHQAEDVAQDVFCALARNARQLVKHPTLSGWLYVATRNEVLNALRADRRRRAREQEAHIMEEIALDGEKPADWSRLRPVLDLAMDKLSAADREAVLLRFFQARPFAEIGSVIGLSEDAARKRVERALDKLRGILQRHGVASTSAALATLLAGETAAALPAGLAASVTAAALAVGGTAAAGLGGLLLITKVQAGVATLVVAGGAAAMILQQQTISSLRDENARTEQTVARLIAEKAALAQSQNDAAAALAPARTEVTALHNDAPAALRVAHAIASAQAETQKPAPTAQATSTSSGDSALRASLHRRYDPFLRKHGLNDAQADRFIDLKIAIADAQADLQSAMRQNGAVGGSAGVESMRSQLVKPMWAEIRSLLGEAGYAAYPEFESTSAVRLGYVEPLLPSFAAAGVPLSEQQADALVKIFTHHRTSMRAQPTDLGTTSIVDWDGVVAEASTVFTPEQAGVLRTIAERRKATRR